MTAPTPPSPPPAPSSAASPAITPEQWDAAWKWIHEAFTNNSAQTVIALLALFLSVIALVNQFSKGRKADLSVRFAKTPDYKYKADRLLITNHGAATAKNIKLELIVKLAGQAAVNNGIVEYPEITAGEHPWKPYRDEEDPFPIEILAPGASFYVPISVSGNSRREAPYALAKLTWKDGRIRRQSWTSTVSSTGQILGGPSLENFHAEKQARIMSYF